MHSTPLGVHRGCDHASYFWDIFFICCKSAPHRVHQGWDQASHFEEILLRCCKSAPHRIHQVGFRIPTLKKIPLIEFIRIRIRLPTLGRFNLYAVSQPHIEIIGLESGFPLWGNSPYMMNEVLVRRKEGIQPHMEFIGVGIRLPIFGKFSLYAESQHHRVHQV